MARLTVLFLLIASLAACTSSGEVARLVETPPSYLPSSLLLDEVPFFPQEAYQCGPAALATTLVHSGSTATVNELVGQVYIPARRGSLQPEMLAATRSHGRIPYLIRPTLEALLNEVNGGRPVLVFQNLGLDWLPQWHYAVVVGFDLDARTVTLRSGTIRDYTVSLPLFYRTWHRTGNWGFVTLKPGELPADADPLRYLEALVAAERVAGDNMAISAYQAAIDRWPENPLFLIGLGNVFYRQGALAQAENQFDRLTALHPEFADGHNNLAQVLLERGEILKAEVHARRAIELGGPRIDIYRETMASIRRQL